MKKCSNCFERKDFKDFYRKKEGYQSRCKACNPEVVAGYRERVRFGEVKRYKTKHH